MFSCSKCRTRLARKPLISIDGMDLMLIFSFTGIQRLVLGGRMGEAIEATQQLYPGLLERDANLLFMLKCRQFIEMVNGTDSEVRGPAIRSPKSWHGSGSNRSSPSMSPVHHSVILQRSSTGTVSGSSGNNSPNRVTTASTIIPTKSSHSSTSSGTQSATELQTITEADMNAANVAMNGDPGTQSRGAHVVNDSSDIDMQDNWDGLCDERTVSNGTATNGTCLNGVTHDQDEQECDMGE